MSRLRDRCPYCGFRGPILLIEGDPLYRCASCNLHIRNSWLVDEPLDHGLERLARDFCPWCGYPMGQETVVPEEGFFECIGCGGTLEPGMLTTQMDIQAHRKKSMKPVGYLVLAIVTIALVLVTVFYFLAGWGR